MLTARRSADRGYTKLDWLDSRHTFSFGDYIDPHHRGFRSLRVINEDFVAPGQGFATHPHRDMEILSYVVSGSMAHRDSMGNGSVIVPGELQRMSAGSGVTHSEFNPSTTEPLHLLQIWIFPEKRGIEPKYEQKAFDLDARRGELILVASHDGRDGSLTIHQDAAIRAGRLATKARVRHELGAGRHAWLQVVRGRIAIGTETLEAGDGVAISDEPSIELAAESDAEVLVFELA